MMNGEGGDADGLRTFEEAKSTLYGTISAAGAALDKASRRRESTVASVAAYLDRIQLDLSGLSVIHVTGTKGKGSTCAMAESVLRHHGFRTGLYTSPHLLEVTERVRCEGKPLTKEAFARYFFQVWDRLQATATATTEMPTYFHLLTLVGLWCFVQEGVDVCVLEVGMGGRFDATNVVPPPVACGVAMLDLDHTQVLGGTLDKIAWEKGGIFKKGCRAMTVEQPRGGMSVLRECAATAGCGELEVVKPLPTRDPHGRAYEIGLAGEHQRINAGLALRLCAVWMEARERQRQQGQPQKPQIPGGTGDTEFRGSEEVHRGLAECVWPGRCQIFRSPAFPAVTVYLDGAHTEQSIHACLEWFIEKTARAADDDNSRFSTPANPKSEVEAGTPTSDANQPQANPEQRRRRRRVLWFNASHERDVVPLLGILASARRRVLRTGSSNSSTGNNANEDDAPLFDEAWFMKVNSARPSRFALPTAQEILGPHAMSPAVVGQEMDSTTSSLPGGSKDTARDEVPAAAMSGRQEKKEASAETGEGAWQRTLQQVWISLQTSTGGMLSETLTGTAPEFLEKVSSMSTTGQDAGVALGSVLGDYDGSVGETVLEILCTGSLYTVAAALEAFGTQVGE
eukprot:g5876.t1